MSYVAIDVEIDHGKVVATKAGEIPKSGSGVLILFQKEGSKAKAPSGLADLPEIIAETWDKLGPAPEIDYDKL